MASPAAVALGGQGRLYPRRRDVPPEPTSAPTGAGQTAAVWHLPHVPGDAAHRVRCGGEPGSAACPGAVCGPGRAAPGLAVSPSPRTTPCCTRPGRTSPSAGAQDLRHRRRGPDPGAVPTPVRPWRSSPGQPGAVAAVARTGPVPGAGPVRDHLEAALARWKAGTARFPRYREKHGPAAGLAPVTSNEKDAAREPDPGAAAVEGKTPAALSRGRRAWQGAGRHKQPRPGRGLG